MAEKYCNCSAPDQKNGFCQNCGEKAWPDEATRYEDIRRKFDAEMRDRMDHPLKHMVVRGIAEEIQRCIDDTNVGQPNRYVSVNLLTRAADRIRDLESRQKSWGGWVLDGWKLVPIQPTKEMREAGAKIGNQGWDFAHHTWRTMLLHAPAAPQQATTALTDGQIKELAGMHGGYLEDCDAWNFCGDRGLVRFARSLLATSPVKESSNG